VQGRVELLGRMREFAWNREGWFVPLEEALRGLTAREAAWRPPGGGLTIWQILNHLNYWNTYMLRRITGVSPDTPVLENEETFGSQGDPNDEDGWHALVAQTRQIAEELRAALADLSESDLDRPLPNMGTVADSLAAWVMHDAYHTGQIILIRKLQGAWPPEG